MVLPRAVLLGVPRAARVEFIASNRVVASRGEVLSRGQTESWTRSVPGTDRVVAKVYAQGALYEAGAVNHEINRELVVDHRPELWLREDHCCC